jgi:hypothetical protein
MGSFYLFFFALTTTLIEVVYDCYPHKYHCRPSMRFSCAVGVCPIGWIVQGMIIALLLICRVATRCKFDPRFFRGSHSEKSTANNIDLAYWGMAFLPPIALAPDH